MNDKATSDLAPPTTPSRLSDAQRQRLRERLARAWQQQRISRRPEPGPAPLSLAQERLWFLERLYPGTALYNLTRALHLTGPLDRDALTAALGSLTNRHESLRTGFTVEEGRPLQTVAAEVGLDLPVTDLSTLPEAERQEAARRYMDGQARRPFDLGRPPLLAAQLLALGPERHILALTLHHLVTDGWSLGILLRELGELYHAHAEGRAPTLPELAVQYADYAVWERRQLEGDALAGDLAFWKEHLGGELPVLDLPLDHPRPAEMSLAGRYHTFQLPAALSSRLDTLAQGERVSLFAVVLAAWSLLLSRWAGQREVVVGTPVANRGEPETEAIVGFFVNTLALRLDLGGDPKARELLRRTGETVLEALAHQRLPFARLVEELAPRRSLSQAPLFQAELVFQNTPAEPLLLPGDVPAVVEVVDKGAAELDLILELEQTPDGLRGDLTYTADLFEAATVERLTEHLEVLLEALAANPDRRLSEISLLTPAARRELLLQRGAGAVEAASHPLPHRLFAARAAESPEATALVCGGESLSYGELAARVHRLARRLRDRGAGPERAVGIFLEPSADLVTALLATLAAGAVSVPLDPGAPPRRLESVVEDGGVALLVSRGDLAQNLPRGPARQIEVVDLDSVDLEEAAAREDASPLPDDPVPESLAYLLFTSGSTGRPKGVMVSHRSLAAHTAAVIEAYGLGPEDRVLQFASPVFDVALEQILPPLAAGATLILRGNDIWSPGDMRRHLLDDGLTVVNLPPAYWHQWVTAAADSGETDWGRLRLLLVGGDVLPRETLAPWWRCGGAEVRLVNAYGPTETTITASLWEVPPGTGRDGELHRVPIGRPLGPERRLLVLDERLEPVPPGVPGELAIGGCLARGYAGRPRSTAERFIPDPFSTVPGERLYRTGDRARLRTDGLVEFLGRTDHQVKVRGFRIELGEIEAVLGRHPAVRQAAVTAPGQRGAEGGRRLVGYVVARDGEEIDVRRLREDLAASLPDYMVPSALVVLDELPLTPAAKVDRRALPEPEAGAGAEEYVAPRTAAEELLASLWAELLELERVGARDHFFDLGGHSLDATRLMYRLEELLGVQVPVRALFEAQTVEELAPRIEAAVTAALADLAPEERPAAADQRLRQALGESAFREEIPRREGDGPSPLSWSQEILWFVEQQPNNPPSIYRHSPVLILRGPLDLAALGRAFEDMARRHEILRTRFGAADDGTSFQVAEADVPIPVETLDLRHLPRPEAETQARERFEEEASRPFDLTRPPLLRPLAVRLEDELCWLLLSIHHIVIDGWAFSVFYAELSELYSAFAQGRAPELAEPEIQYADFALWERRRLSGDYLERLTTYWRGRFADGLPQLGLPTDRPRPPLPSYRGATSYAQVPAELAHALRRRARDEGISLFMLLLAAYNLVLARRSGRDDILVAVANANRPRKQTESLIGSFFNLLLIRTDLSGDPSLDELLRQVRETTLEAYSHQDFPFILVAPGYQSDGIPPGKPPIQTLFTFLNTPPQEIRLHGLEAEVAQIVEHTATDLDLLLSVRDHAEHLHVVLIYDADIFEPATAEAMQQELRQILEHFAHNSERRLSELSVAPALGELAVAIEARLASELGPAKPG